MGRSNDGQGPDLSALAKAAKRAWVRRQNASKAYLEAVDQLLWAACQVVDRALADGGYAKAKLRSGSGGWQQAGFLLGTYLFGAKSLLRLSVSRALWPARIRTSYFGSGRGSLAAISAPRGF